jgi:hypothetical protein
VLIPRVFKGFFFFWLQKMPTRYLKPGVRDSESIESLSANAEILYYRLIVTVDDFGRYDARPSMVKAACFPIRESMTPSKIDALLKELSENELIFVYEVHGKPYMQLCKWDNIPRAKESKYPSFECDCLHVYADARITNTNAPLTVTETETKTVNKKHETAPDGVSPEVWDSFVKQRKSKKAQITENVLSAIDREAKKAGWSLDAALNEIVVRNWQSFKADWVADKQNQTETVYQRSMRLKMQEAVPSIAKQAPEPYQDASDFFRTIDMETQKAIEVKK